MSLSPHKRAWLGLFLSCIVIFAASFAALALLPEPQASWMVELAFLLRAAELFAGFGAILLALAALGATIYPRRKASTAGTAVRRGRV